MTDQNRAPPLLSIIVPFHDSVGKSDRLLGTLAGLDAPDVEFILVDDGSGDRTFEHLAGRRQGFRCPSQLVRQHNKGPGGARNHGLDLSSARYVWFADSDDDIDPAAIDVLRRHADSGYDFVDFEKRSFTAADGSILPSQGARAGSIKFPEGGHAVGEADRLSLLRSVGWLVAKMFRRDFLVGNGVRYPEYCVYEDNPLLFLHPFLVRSFFKSSAVAYHHYQDQESVTRSIGAKGPRFYDRLSTASYGVELTRRFKPSARLRRRIERKFTNIFLIHTLRIIEAADADQVMMTRVMRFYREEAERLGIGVDPMEQVSGSTRYQSKIAELWRQSEDYPLQAGFFEELHLSSWGRPIEYPEAPPESGTASDPAG